MTFFRQNDKRTYCLLTDYNFRLNNVFLDRMTKEHIFITDFET